MLTSILNVRFRLFHLVVMILLLADHMAVGQENSSKTATETAMNAIYDEVWLPFMESYRALDMEQFKAVQAPDLIKVSIDRSTIQPTTAYFKEIEGFFDQFKKMNRQLDIRFSILSTAFGTDKAYQTGYYALGSRNTGSEPFKTMGYGYFTVVLEKNQDGWKISLDADKQARINEDLFSKSGVVYELKE